MKDVKDKKIQNGTNELKTKKKHVIDKKGKKELTTKKKMKDVKD